MGNDDIKRLSQQMWLAGEERELWRQVYVGTLELLADKNDAEDAEDIARCAAAAEQAADSAVRRYQRTFAGAASTPAVGGNDESH